MASAITRRRFLAFDITIAAGLPPALAKEQATMNLYPGIITPKLAETRAFYVDVLGFGVKFETDWFLLLARDGAEVAFLKPDQAAQAPIFRAAFPGHGAWFAIEMDDVDAEYRRLRGLGVKMEVELRDEDWGERHFSIRDPNGVGLDFVRFVPAA